MRNGSARPSRGLTLVLTVAAAILVSCAGSGSTSTVQPATQAAPVSIVFTRLGDRNVTLDTVSTYVPQMRLLSEVKTVFTGKPSFVGEAAFEGKFADAHTGELLGAAIDDRVGGRRIKNFDDWADVKHAIDYWVEGLVYNACTLREGTDCRAP